MSLPGNCGTRQMYLSRQLRAAKLIHDGSPLASHTVHQQLYITTTNTIPNKCITVLNLAIPTSSTAFALLPQTLNTLASATAYNPTPQPAPPRYTTITITYNTGLILLSPTARLHHRRSSRHCRMCRWKMETHMSDATGIIGRIYPRSPLIS